MPRERFTNPANGAFYDWPINHDDEEASGKKRNIENTATTGLGRVRQQTTDDPLVLRYTGSILTQAQVKTMWDWFNLSWAQTIYFTDFEGNVYEVQITEFNPVRKRAVWNPRGGTVNPLHYWHYTIEMQVYRVISGPMAGHAIP